MDLKHILAVARILVRAYFFSKVGWQSPEKIKTLQDRAIRKSVSIAYHHSEFYRKTYDAHGIHPRDITSIEDLPKLPIITKQDLIQNNQAAIPGSLDRNSALLMKTSGSTGQPTQIYKDHNWLAHSMAFGIQMLRMHKMGLPKAAFILDVNSISSIEQIAQGYLKYLTQKAVIMPVELDIRQIITRLENNNIQYIATYSGFMRELATLRKNGEGKNIRLKAIGVSGEILDEYTRKHIEEAFDCPCYSAYVATEGGPMAIECVNKKMHVNSEMVAIEIVDEKGEPCPPGVNGNIVVTGHEQGNGIPVIRYSGLGDVAHYKNETCTCGLNTPIISSIQGRKVDSIRLPDGRIFHAFTMTIPMEKIQRANNGSQKIRQYQIEQYALDKIRIRIVRNQAEMAPEETLADVMDVIQRTYQQQLGNDMRITVEEVAEIPKGNNLGMPTPLVISQIKDF